MILPPGPEKFDLLESIDILEILGSRNQWQLYLEGSKHVIEEGLTRGFVRRPYEGPLNFLLDELSETLKGQPSSEEQALRAKAEGLLYLDGEPDVQQAHNYCDVDITLTSEGVPQLACHGVALIISEMFRHE